MGDESRSSDGGSAEVLAQPLFGPTMPLPLVDEDTAEFWAACADHRLVVQQCDECDRYRFAPAPICHHCRSRRYRLAESAGFGEVYTWTVTHRSVHPGTVDVVPFNTVVVRLDDCGHALVTSNLVDVDNDEIEAGLRVVVVWDDVAPGCSVPRFRRRS